MLAIIQKGERAVEKESKGSKLYFLQKIQGVLSWG